MKAVLIPTLTAAKNVDIYNGSFIATTDLDNGNVFAKGDLTESGSQVYKAGQPITGKLFALINIAIIAGKQVNAYGFPLKENFQHVQHCFHRKYNHINNPIKPVLMKTEIIMLWAVLVAKAMYFDAMAPFSPTINP